MIENTQPRSYLCSSADWDIVVADAENHEQAAAFALETLIASELGNFSVGSSITVVPIIRMLNDTKVIYSPSVLADIGMHKYASELIKHIDEDV
jgi:hypothetical protein